MDKLDDLYITGDKNMSKAIDYLNCPKCGCSMECKIRPGGNKWECQNKKCRKSVFEEINEKKKILKSVWNCPVVKKNHTSSMTPYSMTS